MPRPGPASAPELGQGCSGFSWRNPKGLSQESESLGALSGTSGRPLPIKHPRWMAGPSGTSKRRVSLPAEGPPLSNTTFPHVLPLITLLECDSAPAEGPEPWGSTEHGVEVVLAHLEAARTVAHHGGLYHTNAEVKLQGESWVATGGDPATDPASLGLPPHDLLSPLLQTPLRISPSLFPACFPDFFFSPLFFTYSAV